MMAEYFALYCLSFLAGGFRSRLWQATHHWGKILAYSSKAPDELSEKLHTTIMDAFAAAGVPGLSTGRGFQDFITPRVLNTGIFVVQVIVRPFLFVWGFYLFPWYAAIGLGVLTTVLIQTTKNLLPGAESHFFHQLLLTRLQSRANKLLERNEMASWTVTEHLCGLLKAAR